MANRIKGLTVEIDGNTTGLDKALKSVNSTISQSQTQLKDVQRLLKLDPSNTELLSQKQRLLKEAIGATNEKLESLKTAQEQAKKQLEDGKLGQDKYDALQREIEETEQALNNLESQVSTTYSALEKIDSVGDKLQKTGDKVAGVGKSLTTNVTAPIVGIGAAAVKTTADFDAQMSKVQAISGAAGDEFDELRNKAREMGAKTKYSASEAGEAFEYMAMAGWKTEDMLDGVEGIMNLAAASGEELGTTSDIVTDALTAFGLSAKDSGHFADVLAAASSNANTNVSMLGESFKYAAPVAGSLGINAEDTSVALGLMANAGIKASQAGTALRTGLTNLAKPTKQMQDYMDEYNIALVENDDGSINLRKTMASLRKNMRNLSESEQAAAASAIFGKNSMAGWLAVINASDEDFDKLTGAIDNCDGTAEDMADTMQDNLSGQLTILKSQLEELAISFGDILMPIVREVTESVQKFVDKLNSMSDSQKKTVVKVLALTAAIGPLLLIIGKTVSTVGSAMKGFSMMGKGVMKLAGKMKAAGGLSGVLGKAIGFLTSPIGLVVAAIAVLVAAFVHLWKSNEDFREKVTQIWESIKSKFRGFVEGIEERLNNLGISFSDITSALGAVWDGFCNLLAPVFIGTFELIENTFSATLDILTGLFDIFSGIFTGNWDLTWQGIKEVFSGVWDNITGIFDTALNTIKGIADVILGWFGTDWESFWNGIKQFFTDLWEGIKSFFSDIWESIKSYITGVLSSIAGTFSEKWEAIKTTVTTVVGDIKRTVTEKWEQIKQDVIDKVDSIKTKVTAKWDEIKTSITSKVDSIKQKLSSKFEEIKEKASTLWKSIKEAMVAPIESAKEKIGNAIDKIKSMFNFSWDIPKPKIPHFSWGWKDIGGVVSVPDISVDWYKKAMNGGMILDSPTIFGAMNGQLLGAGEAGSETVVGTHSLMDMIRQAVGSAERAMNVYYGGVTVNVYSQPGQDISELADEIEERISLSVARRNSAFV